jgi:hypothetical protein
LADRREIASASFLVLGAGHFGQRAVRIISKHHARATITLVDLEPEALDNMLPEIDVVTAEAVTYLDRVIDAKHELVVIPAIPVHVAFSWLFARLERNHRIESYRVPDGLNLPNCMRGDQGDVYASCADFRCPDNCTEPQKACPETRKPHGKPMYQRIAELSSPALAVRCIHSEQLGPGVGGFKAKQLHELWRAVETMRGPILVATACRCHAVISGLSVVGRG